jgi:hypothetical protein
MNVKTFIRKQDYLVNRFLRLFYVLKQRNNRIWVFLLYDFSISDEQNNNNRNNNNKRENFQGTSP